MISNPNILKNLGENVEDKEWNSIHKIDDIWQDLNGKSWKKLANNTRIEITERKIGPIVAMLCPKCNRSIRRIDEEYMMKYEYCFDCFVEEEYKNQIKNLNKVS